MPKAIATQTLYVLIRDGGDGSSYPRYTMDAGFIAKLRKAYDEGKMDSENGMGCDGDGFHYSTIEVPADWTAEQMGISLLDPENYEHLFSED